MSAIPQLLAIGGLLLSAGLLVSMLSNTQRLIRYSQFLVTYWLLWILFAATIRSVTLAGWLSSTHGAMVSAMPAYFLALVLGDLRFRRG